MVKKIISPFSAELIDFCHGSVAIFSLLFHMLHQQIIRKVNYVYFLCHCVLLKPVLKCELLNNFASCRPLTTVLLHFKGVAWLIFYQ